MFNGGQHGVASHSTLSVGKPTDGDIVGHSETHTLGSVQNANSRIVVDSKEAIGDIITLQQFRSNGLSIRTIVADAGNALVKFQTMFQEGILVAIETVLRNLQSRSRTIEGYALATRLNEMGHCIEGAHIVVHHYPTRIHARTYSIIEDQGDTRLHQTLEMIVPMGILRLRDDNATNLVLAKRLTNAHLTLIALTTQCHDDKIASGGSFLLNASQHRREIKMSEFRYDDTDHFDGLHLGMAQRLSQHIGCKVMLTRILLNHCPSFC